MPCSSYKICLRVIWFLFNSHLGVWVISLNLVSTGFFHLYISPLTSKVRWGSGKCFLEFIRYSIFMFAPLSFILCSRWPFVLPRRRVLVALPLIFIWAPFLSLGWENGFVEWVSWDREFSTHKGVLGCFWTWPAINQDTGCYSHLPTLVGLSVIRMLATILHFKAWEEQL